MALTYVDIVLVLVLAVPALALGAPPVGYAAAATAWIVARAVSHVADRRIAGVDDYRRRIGLGVGSAMSRVWFLAVVIMGVGLAVSRADGLTAALVIFGAFSVNFAHSAITHMAERRRMNG